MQTKTGRKNKTWIDSIEPSKSATGYNLSKIGVSWLYGELKYIAYT